MDHCSHQRPLTITLNHYALQGELHQKLHRKKETILDTNTLSTMAMSGLGNCSPWEEVVGN